MLKYLAANVGKAMEVARLLSRVAAQRAGDRLGTQAEQSVRACSKNAAVLLHLVPVLRVAVDGVVGGGPTILVTGEPRIRLLTVAVGVQVCFLPLVQGVGATVVFLLLVRAALLSGEPLVLQHEGLQLPGGVVDGGVRWLLPDVCVVCLWTR